MNEAAYRVLRGGKAADAVVLFQLNAALRRFVEYLEQQEAQRAAGDIEASKASYAKALARYPGDEGDRGDCGNGENRPLVLRAAERVLGFARQ